MMTLPREETEEPLDFCPPTQDSPVSSTVSEQSLLCPGILAWRGVTQLCGPGQGIERPWNREELRVKEGQIWVLGVPVRSLDRN